MLVAVARHLIWGIARSVRDLSSGNSVRSLLSVLSVRFASFLRFLRFLSHSLGRVKVRSAKCSLLVAVCRL